MEVEQAERVGDRSRGPCRRAPRRRSWVSPNSSIELAVRERLLDRVEVGALHVLDERDLELVAIGELADERGDVVEAGEARRAHATLAGDELVAVEGLRDEDRLEHAVLADARRELLERRRRRSGAAGWCGFGRDAGERDLGRPRPRRSGAAGSATPRPRPSARATFDASCDGPRERRRRARGARGARPRAPR